MIAYVLNYFGLEDIREELEGVIKDTIVKFGYKLAQKWKESSRTRERFLRNNNQWLESNVDFPELKPYLERENIPPSTSRGPGRPSKSFEDSSEKTKRRKIQPLMETSRKEELLYAAQATLRSEGKRDAALLLKDMVTTSPKRATHIKKSFRSPPTFPERKISNEEALATYLDGKMTKRSYTAVQQRLKSVGSKVLPSYPFITEAKKKCYPDNVSITEISTKVSLQSLINHTTKRICDVQANVLLLVLIKH